MSGEVHQQKSFIQKIALYIKENGFEMENLVLIVPSDRAANQLRIEIAKTFSKPIFAPTILTIDKWMKPTLLHVIDETRQLLSLYEISAGIPGVPNASFEEFLTWGKIALRDFGEVDRYLLDAAKVFKNLESIKELESWQIDEEDYSESQKKFLDFWKVLPDLYTSFHLSLEKKQQTTPGRAYRMFAETTQEFHSPEAKQYFIFAGFNALTKAELVSIKKILDLEKGVFLSDADLFYINDNLHEAGGFLRKNHEFLESPYKPDPIHVLLNKSLNAKVIECAQHIGQVKVAANELSKLNPSEISSTLVLLCDEALIGSMIHHIPDNVIKTNLTLGLPLTQTSVKSWIDILFQIQENKVKFQTDSVYFYDLQRFVNHAFTISSLNLKEVKDLGDAERDAIRYNRIFQNRSKLKKSRDLSVLCDLVFEDWGNDWKKALLNIRELNSFFLTRIGIEFEFEKTILQVLDDAIIELQNIIEEGIPEMSQKSFKLFFDQHWIGKSISFAGDQEDGLQIMGLLETRMLDFKNVIALGMNEGKLPATNPIQSFIPMDLRSGLGLPTTREKQGLFAHHFYRLLHHCENFTATFSSTSEQIGSQEKSRYLLQLELELERLNPNIAIENLHYNVPIEGVSESNSQVIERSPLIIARIEKYFKKHISASALNTYLRCPLDFYYRYIAELGEERGVEEDIESQQFGSLVHHVLEELYKPFALYDSFGKEVQPKPKAVQSEDITKMLKDYKSILYNAFLAYFDNDEQLFLKGKNLISYTIAQDTLENTLKKELVLLKGLKEDLFIVQVEAKKTMRLELMVHGEKREVSFTGYIDRIDKIGNNYRVIDYKSGKVKDQDVKFSEKENPILTFSKCKHAVQLAMYSLFLKDSFGCYPSEASIFSITDIKQLSYSLHSDSHSLEEISNLFKKFLERLLEEIFDETQPIEHSEDSKYCNYCQ
ncbi:MAG: PD-(D/E)XK nuclease family protein [Crocinitomicaceae bacterium]|tara:strand:+ start:3974 stop:6799 length:2826 start_codon:yes stop_codon:yes gene_type:complete